jgi:GlpG protein
MRLIGTLDDERKALTFSHFLHQKGIPHQIEIQKNMDWGSSSYGSSLCQVWIQEEDHTEEVLKWFQLFLENPNDPLFSFTQPSAPGIKTELPLPLSPAASPLPPPQSSTQSWSKQPMGWMTRVLLGICIFLFFLSQLILPTIQVPEKYAGLALFTSPIEKALLFDYPKFYELINRFIHLYGFDELERPSDLPPEGKRLLQQINQTPFWPGYYQLLLKGGWQSVKEGLVKYPSFEKIREGQIWRLFTPCLLHGDLFHLFFNMLWLIVLGKQMEQRLSPWRYAIFILVVGVVSNTAQYLMSGPNFIGFSGVLVGMLAFIWVRQKMAAWEGYQIDRLTFVFMLIFILSMAAIQLFSFFLEKSFEWALSPNIANMAHLTGGVMGFILGRLNFFSWRHT